jgi:tetratricopeptide (TPR) repeat protein
LGDQYAGLAVAAGSRRLLFFQFVSSNLKLLLRLLTQPAAAMSDILDRGSLLFASLAVICVSLLFAWNASSGPSFSFYTPLLVLAAVYVPGVLLLGKLLGRLGSLGILFQRDYAPLLTCAAMAWAAANLPLALLGRTFSLIAFVIVGWLACMYFAVLMFFAVRTIFGTGNGTAMGVVSLSWLPLLVVAFFLGPLRFLLNLVASPFFLIFAFFYLRSEFSRLGDGLRRQQSLRRMLEAAAVNPHDGEAQYQIGLIYQQRRRYTDAIERFRNAVAIDPQETDAHFQLGRIAFQQQRFTDALGHFETVLAQDQKHSQSEILRELGAVYLTLGRHEDARRELAIYVDRRPYDPQGLYYYGRVLEELGDKPGAREAYAQAVEAARTAPRYRRPVVAEWSRLAQRQARKMAD